MSGNFIQRHGSYNLCGHSCINCCYKYVAAMGLNEISIRNKEAF